MRKLWYHREVLLAPNRNATDEDEKQKGLIMKMTALFYFISPSIEEVYPQYP